MTFILSGAKLTAEPLDPAYHSPDEIYFEIIHLEEEYPEWVKVDSVGYSAEYERPIWMVKLSDNPQENEPEPAILLIGQVHAEEVIGVEITLEIMKLLLENLGDNNFRRRLEGIELYVIPTANPEGLEVVHSDDVTFRKNRRDNIGDGQFRYDERAGWDTSGVDLNRNFGLHWDRGDSLLQRRDEQYAYNYFRGSGPFSEPETQILRDLALEHRFFASLSYHGSRSGNSSELVIAPWYWEHSTKDPPDRVAINALGSDIAERIPTQNDRQNHYQQVNSTQRNGQSQDWFYQAVGTFQYMVEAGAEVQPDSAVMRRIVDDNLDAVWYLMDLALGIEAMNGYGFLTVYATDVHTGEPLEAVISVDRLDNPIVEPRKTSALSGRFDWLMPDREYNITISKFGYNSQVYFDTEVLDGERTTLAARMNPINPVNCRFRITDSQSGDPLNARIILQDSSGSRFYDIAVEDGQTDVSLQPYDYRVIILSEDHLPYVDQLVVDAGVILDYELHLSDVVFSDEFNIDRGWQQGGGEEDWGIVLDYGRTALTESRSGAYPSNSDTRLWVESRVEIDTMHGAVLEMIHRPYFEPGADFGCVSAQVGNFGETIYNISQFPQEWDTVWVDLDQFEYGELILRFEVFTDYYIEEDGWLIDKITIYQSDQRYEEVEFEQEDIPGKFLMTAFPNPANASAIVSLNLPILMNGKLLLYDQLGRRVSMLANGSFSTGNHRYYIDGTALPSGAYYLKFQTESASKLTRLIFVK